MRKLGTGPGPGPGDGLRISARSANRTRTTTATLPTVNKAIGQVSSLTGGSRREIFFLHVEEGYFGCQVNESTDVLQIYDISKLCNGVSDCYHGSDENRAQLKCTSKLIEITISA